MTVLAGVILLALAGCQQRTIDATQFKEAEWEKSITGSSLSENEFVRLYALKLANELKGSTVRITGRRELTVKLADGTEVKAFLDNVCADVKANPTNRIEICNKYITGLVRSQQTINEAAGAPDTNSIVVVIRDDLFLKQFENYGATKTNHVVAEPLVADLHVAYARDSENGIAYLMQADQSKLGLGLPALRQLALSNLHRILPAPKIYKIGPVFMVEADGNYESSLLLADKLWDNEASAVTGDLVAAVPTRNTLLFTGSGSAGGLKAMRAEVDDLYKKSSHVISRTLLVRRNGRWEKFSD
jgi:uncharacterized protein YtpQ (UPF0354 family)